MSFRGPRAARGARNLLLLQGGGKKQIPCSARDDNEWRGMTTNRDVHQIQTLRLRSVLKSSGREEEALPLPVPFSAEAGSILSPSPGARKRLSSTACCLVYSSK